MTRVRSAGSGGHFSAVLLFSEFLIGIGVLALGFVLWDLFYTGLAAESDRQDSLDELSETMTEVAEESSFDVCHTLDDGTEIGCASHMRAHTDGESVAGTLYAPRLGDDWAAPVRQGVSSTQLDRGGVGRYTTSQFPDETGNFAVAGHRNTNGSMLGDQDMLRAGDEIYFAGYDGIYVYQVVEREVVLPWENRVIAPDPGDEYVEAADAEHSLLTLTTCHPMFSNAERLIHHAELVDFIEVGEQVPAAIAEHDFVAEHWQT